MTRAIMTAAELATHRTRQYGRDYGVSYDGYSDMEAEERRGWQALACWGRDGWNLGNWPYVAICTRVINDGRLEADGKLARAYELMQIVEGDRTAYSFDTAEDRDAAVDYLFLWYAAGQDWAPLRYDQRAELDEGELPVDQKWRGSVRA